MQLVETMKRRVPQAVKDVVGPRVSVHIRDRARTVKLFGVPALREIHDPHYFIHIPKAAGTSVKKYLLDQGLPEVVLTHRTTLPNYKLPHEFLKKEDQNAFCIVRNPFTRLASAYFFLQEGGMGPSDVLDYKEYFSNYDGFEDFVLRGLGEDDTRKSLLEQTHLIPQTRFLVNANGDLCVAPRNILRFENLEEDLARYLSSRGHFFEGLPWKNRTGNKQNYLDLYLEDDGTVRSDLIDVVVDCYREDFERLEYSKEVE